MTIKNKFQLFFLIFLCASLLSVAQESFDHRSVPIEDPQVQVLWDSLSMLNDQHRYFETFPLLYALEVLAEEKNEPRVLASVLENIASMLNYQGKFKKSKEYHFKAYNLYEKHGQLENLSLIMSGLSNIEQFEGNMSKAFEYSYTAKSLAKYSERLSPFISAHNDLGVLHHLSGEYDSAYYYRKIVLDNVKEKDSTYFNKANINMATTLISIFDYEKASEYLSTALRFTNPNKYPLSFGSTLGAIGELEYLKGNFLESEKTLKECIHVLESSKNNAKRLLTYYPEYASALIKNKKHNEAKTILQKTEGLVQDQNHQLKIAYYFPKWELAILNKNKRESSKIYTQVKPLYREEHFKNKERFYQLEARYFSLLGDDTQALQAFQKHSSIKDTLQNLLRVKAIENLEIKYDTEKKENEIGRLELEDQLNQSRIKQQRFTIGGLTGGLGLLGLLLYRIFGQNKKIKEQNTIIGDALASKETLLKEIHHRVKNNLQVISSLLGIQSRQLTDTRAKEALQEGRSRVHSMSLIHQNLYKKDNLAGIEMRDYLKKLSKSIISTYSLQADNIEIQYDIDDIILDVDTVIPIGLITNELLTNSLKYAFPEDAHGKIQIKLKHTPDTLVLSVSDNGIGLDPDQLRQKKESFGHSLIQAFRKKLDASIDIDGTEGTNVSINIRNYKIVSAKT